MNDKLDKELYNNMSSALSRRDLLKAGMVGALASALPVALIQDAEASTHQEWRLRFKQAHTGEGFDGVYRVGDRYLPEAFEKLNYVLRDFRTGEVFPMDPHVLDIISMVQRKAGGNKTMRILSGYRSPKTNSRLRNASTGVAKNSFHMYGQAIDMNLEGVSARRVRDIAKSLRAGGVGYYRRSGFVHVDTGDVRSW